jgi:hypothetical protein
MSEGNHAPFERGSHRRRNEGEVPVPDFQNIRARCILRAPCEIALRKNRQEAFSGGSCFAIGKRRSVQRRSTSRMRIAS